MPERLKPESPLRRRALLCGALIAGPWLLAACGGGGGGSPPPPGTPVIERFSAEKPSHFVGERATLTATFSGGAGRIEPGIGAVVSGVPVLTPVLDAGTSVRLVVESAAGTVSRVLELPVQFRNRYETLAAPFAVSYHASVTAGDGSVLILGGSRGVGAPSDAIDRFDPVTRGFTRIGSMRTGRLDHTATRLPDGRILVAGGVQGVQIGNVADLVDERTGTVSDGGRLTAPRSWHAATLLADGRVMLVGGYNRATVEIWDPATNQWRAPASPMAHARERPTATLLADGRVLITGGAPASPVADYRFAEVFDPRTETFAPVSAPGIGQRIFHSAHRLSDGTVLIVGGQRDAGGGAPSKSALRFDPATMKITSAPDLHSARAQFQSVMVPGDWLLLFGGLVEPDAHTGSAELYTRTGGTPLAPLAAMRARHTVNRLADGRILVVGGEDVNGGYATPVQIYE